MGLNDYILNNVDLYNPYTGKLEWKNIDIPYIEPVDTNKDHWNITGESNYSKTFIIPVNGLSKEKAKENIKELMSKYQEDITWDDDNGELIFKSPNLPIPKDIWLPIKTDNISDWIGEYTKMHRLNE